MRLNEIRENVEFGFINKSTQRFVKLSQNPHTIAKNNSTKFPLIYNYTYITRR